MRGSCRGGEESWRRGEGVELRRGEERRGGGEE